MSIPFTKHWNVLGLSIALIMGTFQGQLHAQSCSACLGEETKVKFQLRGVASMAGHVTVRVTYGDTEQTTTMDGGTIVPDGSGGFEAGTYECVQWAEEISVEPALDQPVLISYEYEHSDQDPDYTEFEPVGGPNPVTYYARPSSPCLRVYFDLNDGDWFPEAPFFLFDSDQMRIKGVIAHNDSTIGNCLRGPEAGGGSPVVDSADLMDPQAVGDLMDACPGGGAFMSSMASTSQTSGAGTTDQSKTGHVGGVKMREPHLDASKVVLNSLDPKTGKASRSSTQTQKDRPIRHEKPELHGNPHSQMGLSTNLVVRKPSTSSPKRQTATSSTKSAGKKTDVKVGKNAPQSSPNPPQSSPTLFDVESSGNGYTVAQQIGRLRWEMSLGSLGRALTLGNVIYQADVLDATAYSPDRLRLSLGSDPLVVVPDPVDGHLRQAKMDEYLVDITTITAGFRVSVYPIAQVEAPDPGTGIFAVTGDPALRWTIENPDATPQGKVRFTKTVGAATIEVHEAQWTGTAGAAGTMTLLRHNAKWKEVREYSLNGAATQRTEIISLYKNNVLQRKAREVYQQFATWSTTGDVFEALVERVEDPGGKNLTTSFTYWELPTQAGRLYETVSPDGYAEQVPDRLSGNGFSPVVSSGGELTVRRPFKDIQAGSAGHRATFTSYDLLSPQEIEAVVETRVSGEYVGYQFAYHLLDNGYWITATKDYTDYNFGNGTFNFAYQEKWLEITTRRPVFNLDSEGRTQTIFYDPGFWHPTLLLFSSSPISGSVSALRTTIVNGTIAQQTGILNKTTVEERVEDQFGHLVRERTFINNGFGAGPLIDQKVHTYTAGRLTATVWNGRLVYEATYDSDGKMESEKDDSERQTDYLYDEMRRVSQKTVQGRAGDDDKVCTYEYDVAGNMISETTTAGTLSVQRQWTYNLAGELTSMTDWAGLTTSLNTTYPGGLKLETETLPTQATRITSYFRDRRVRSVTGTAVEDEYHNVLITSWTGFSVREAESIYRDAAMTQLKSTRLVNWIGNEIFLQTPRFAGAGFRNKDTSYNAFNFVGPGHIRPLVAKVVETGRATQLFTYDNLGLLTASGLDLNNNGTLDDVSLEPKTVYNQFFANDTGPWQAVRTTQRLLQDNSGALTLVQRARVTVPSALSGNVIASGTIERPGGGIVATTVTLDDASHERTTTVNDVERGQTETTVTRDDLLRSQTKSGITTPTTYTYTALGEQLTINHPVSGTVTYGYNATTRQLASATDSLSRQTLYDYYPAGVANAGKVKGIRDLAGAWTYFDYTPAGQVYRKWGVNTYPVQQVYDEAGRLTSLTTFRTTPGTVNWASSTWPNPAGGDVTQWVYDSPSELLERKIYADAGAGAKTVIYTYNSGHFPATKVNGRLQTITYTIDTAGLFRGVTYSDGTPPATLDYDRGGRLKSVIDASGTRTISWTDRDQMKDETYTAGLLSGVTLTRGYDSKFRPETLGVSLGGVPVLRQRNTFDSISWLDYITDETPDGATVLHKFDYSYQAGKPFVQSVAFLRGTTPVMNDNYTHDSLGRFSAAGTTLAGGGTLQNTAYLFDNLDRRYRADLADGSRWEYNFDQRNEVTGGKRRLPSNAMAGGEQFEYGYDDIGNRTVARFGGDAAGGNLRSSSYSANALNQYTSRGVPGSMWIVGEAPTGLELTAEAANQSFSLQRQDGNRFFGEATFPDGSAPIYAKIRVAAKSGGVLTDLETGFEFLPRNAANAENFTYDFDRNLTSDGRWTYTWDAENRLVSVTARTDIPDAAKRKVDFVYDFAGRRVQKVVSTWNGSGYTAQTTSRFVYDGWNLIAILDPLSALRQSFVWGLDMSGTSQGAGGVGGLLQATFYGASTTNCFPGFDGNGNVMALVNAADGSTAARYTYGPFGEVVRRTGPLAAANAFRFSSKFEDEETGLLYYGFRYYNSSTGRWLSGDPIQEEGGVNLYSFVNNCPICSVDYVGLWKIYDLLKDAPTGPVDLQTKLPGFNHSAVFGELINQLKDRYAPVAFIDKLSKQLTPLKFGANLGRATYEKPKGTVSCQCVFLSIFVQGELPSVGKAKVWPPVGLGAGGAITITDCRDWKSATELGYSGSISVDLFLGLSTSAASAVGNGVGSYTTPLIGAAVKDATKDSVQAITGSSSAGNLKLGIDTNIRISVPRMQIGGYYDASLHIGVNVFGGVQANGDDFGQSIRKDFNIPVSKLLGY